MKLKFLNHNLIGEIVISLFLLLNFSCNDDNSLLISSESNLKSEEVIEKVEKDYFLEFSTKILGTALRDDEVKKIIGDEIFHSGNDQASVSFGYLFDNDQYITESEKSNILRDRTNKIRKINALKDALEDAFEQELSKTNVLSRHPINSIDDLIYELTINNYQLYIPYLDDYVGEEDYTVIDYAPSSYYISYSDGSSANSNDGYYHDNNGPSQPGAHLTNDFIDNHFTYLIIPIDPCDVIGNNCGFRDVDETTYMPPPSNSIPQLISYNINHNDILEKDILSVKIPEIKIEGVRWMGFGGSHQKLRLFRANAVKLNQDSNGNISVTGVDRLIDNIRVKRKYLKREDYWIGMPTGVFDEDWSMSKNQSSLVIFSIHNLSGSASASIGVKGGWTKDGVSPEPTAEATVKVSTSSAKFRGSLEMQRRFYLISIVGSNDLYEKTRRYRNVDYNVKRTGIFNCFFNYYYTEL